MPAEIIVAIIGVETHFGRITGNFRTLDVFTTLTFDYLRRADFYRAEFIEFLLLAREQRRDPMSYRGSFAGAIGLPQFMPGSIRRWGVDFDGDGRIDLLASPADAIGSVASFLVAHGWQRDLPIVFEAEADESIVDALGRGIEAADDVVRCDGRRRDHRCAAATRHRGARHRPAAGGRRRAAVAPTGSAP